MRRRTIDRQTLLAAERRRIEVSPHGALRIGLGYPSTYHVAQSSLAFQWVLELASQLPEVGVERFFAGSPQTFEGQRALAGLDLLAWSCSFEPDAVNILRTLDAAGIARRRDERRPGHPLLVLGGPVALINPLPLAPVIDCFCLGPAESTLPRLVQAALHQPDRQALLTDLAEQDGFFVPALHLDRAGRPLRRLRLARLQAHDTTRVPASHLVTPYTEYAGRGLLEISRGCPEHCRFCWIGSTAGRFRPRPVAAVLERIGELAELGDRIGLVATAVGDHPELCRILAGCQERGLEVSVSSLRVTAMVPEVLQLLAATGTRSVTIAPETGTDQLRQSLGKELSNEQILAAVAQAQRAGLESLKLYFLLGLPHETEADIDGIAELIRQVRSLMDAFGRERGRLTTLHVGVNLLVPKPYTPLHRQPVLGIADARKRLGRLRRGLRGLANYQLDAPSLRETRWQAYLSRAGTEAFALLEQAAQGLPLGQLLRQHQEAIEAVIGRRWQGPVPWHFLTAVPASGVSQKLGV